MSWQGGTIGGGLLLIVLLIFALVRYAKKSAKLEGRQNTQDALDKKNKAVDIRLQGMGAGDHHVVVERLRKRKARRVQREDPPDSA